MVISYWCPTEKSAEYLLHQWKIQGYKWKSLASLSFTAWDIFKEDTVYCLRDELVFIYAKPANENIKEYIPENTIYNLIKEREYDRKSLLVSNRGAS